MMDCRRIYKEKFEEIYEDQDQSIERAVRYMWSHFPSMPEDFIKARKKLSEAEKNDIIRDVSYPF